MALDALRQLAIERSVIWDGMSDDISVSEESYDWQLSSMASNVRFRIASKDVRDTPSDAFSDAVSIRDAVLALGWVLNSRCELGVVSSTNELSEVVGWRGRVDLGLLSAP